MNQPQTTPASPLQKMMNSSHPADNQANSTAAQKKASPVLDSTIQRVFADLSNQTRRLRLLEERFIDMRKKIELIEENAIAGDKEIHNQNKAMLEMISEQKKVINDMKEKMNIMIKELQASAKLSDLKVLEKYIQMWEPINYVTTDEMDRNVGHLVDLKMNELNMKIQQEKYIEREVKKEVERQLAEFKKNFNLNNSSNNTIKSQDTYSEINSAIPKKKDILIKPRYDANESNNSDSKSKEVDEVEEISKEINDMFKKKNELNGLKDTDEDEIDEEDNKFSIDHFFDKN